MTGVELIIGALAAGSAAGIANTAGNAIGDAYSALKALLTRRLSTRSGADAALESGAADLSAWRARLGAELIRSGAADDQRVLEAARQLLDLLDATGMPDGRHHVDLRMAKGVQVGNYNTQNNAFS
ncbi:hypothetical protein [Dactylosporangium fulvum]|uniref:RHIM domain-containing protein n=1 Tax=Dactylosporangium fulvum TaxID=53359 RepID=A0ABY5VTT1_9ACTN|nr:hypothetical protein [Dactylosporangium fulvum]UWP80559.1 hypothetical protein Dfulv_36135 [Dactylosporangium fulvum]